MATILLSFVSLCSAAPQDKTQSLVKVGEDVEVPRAAAVDSAVAVGGSVTVLGRVREDAVAVGGSVNVKGRGIVEGDAVAIGGKVIQDPGAIVRGDTVEIAAPGLTPMMGFFTGGGLFGGLLLMNLLNFAGFLLVTIVIVAFLTNPLLKVSARIDKSIFKAFLWGVLALILIVPVVIILAISLVGIIFIPVWMVLVVAAILFGYISASQLLGKKILQAFKIKAKTTMLETLLGVVLLWLIGMVPFLGWLIKGIAVCCGLGGVVLTRFGTQTK
jgi:hypothetical protein